MRTMPKKFLDPVAEFWSRIDKSGGMDGCWLWAGSVSVCGYGTFQGFKRSGRFKTRFAHRIAYSLTHGILPPEKHVCHRCDNPPCCNPSHLWLGTQADNMRDCLAKGRKTRPPHPLINQAARLSPAQVLVIRERLVGGSIPTTLAREFGVGSSTVYRIRDGAAWAWVS